VIRWLTDAQDSPILDYLVFRALNLREWCCRMRLSQA